MQSVTSEKSTYTKEQLRKQAKELRKRMKTRLHTPHDATQIYMLLRKYTTKERCFIINDRSNNSPNYSALELSIIETYSHGCSHGYSNGDVFQLFIEQGACNNDQGKIDSTMIEAIFFKAVQEAALETIKVVMRYVENLEAYQHVAATVSNRTFKHLSSVGNHNVWVNDSTKTNKFRSLVYGILHEKTKVKIQELINNQDFRSLAHFTKLEGERRLKIQDETYYSFWSFMEILDAFAVPTGIKIEYCKIVPKNSYHYNLAQDKIVKLQQLSQFEEEKNDDSILQPGELQLISPPDSLNERITHLEIALAALQTANNAKEQEIIRLKHRVSILESSQENKNNKDSPSSQNFFKLSLS